MPKYRITMPSTWPGGRRFAVGEHDAETAEAALALTLADLRAEELTLQTCPSCEGTGWSRSSSGRCGCEGGSSWQPKKK